MNLELLRESRKTDMAMRMEAIMSDNYFGGDTLIVKNVTIVQEGNDNIGQPEVKNQYFSANELEFIERENVLDYFKEDWNIEIVKHGTFEDVDWLFSAKK